MVVARSRAGYRLRQLWRDAGWLAGWLAWFVVRGHGRWIGKAWTFFAYGDLRADARAARIAGDPQARRSAQELIRADSYARWVRAAMVIERFGGGALAVGAVAVLL